MSLYFTQLYISHGITVQTLSIDIYIYKSLCVVHVMCNADTILRSIAIIISIPLYPVSIYFCDPFIALHSAKFTLAFHSQVESTYCRTILLWPRFTDVNLCILVVTKLPTGLCYLIA